MNDFKFDGKVFWGKGAPNPPEEEGYPDIPRSLDELIPHAIAIQEILNNHGVKSLLTGGAAIDVLGSELLQNHIPRKHKDIDILIPRYMLLNLGNSELLYSIGFRDFKPWKANMSPEWEMARDYSNLRVFVNQQGVRVDMMGFDDMNNVGFIPQMTWGGKVDLMGDGTWFSTYPYTLDVGGSSLQIVNPVELDKMLRSLNLITQSKPNKQFDLQVLQRINETQSLP